MKTIANTIFIILLILATFFLVRSYSHADNWIPYDQRTVDDWPFQELLTADKYKKKTTAELRDEWVKELENHKANAIRCYEDAKNKCWWLPDVPDRERARYCYNSAFASLGSSTPSTRLLLMVGSLLLQYGLDCQDEWHYIDNKMNWAKFHFEMCDHYMKLLENN